MEQAFGDQLEVTLIPGAGGVFEVLCDQQPLFSKKQLGRFPDPGEILRLLRGQG